MYMLSCSSIFVYHFIASYTHCVHMYYVLCVLCLIFTCTYKHNKHDSVFVFNACNFLRESIIFLCFLPDSKLNTPTDPINTTPTEPLKTTPTNLLMSTLTDPLKTTFTEHLKTTPTYPLKTTPTGPLMTTPTLSILNRHVIPHVYLDWQCVGHELEVDLFMMEIIDDDNHHDVEKCCRTMFTRWLSHDEGTGGAPRLWRTVLKALKNVGYTNLVGDVERTLFEYQ